MGHEGEGSESGRFDFDLKLARTREHLLRLDDEIDGFVKVVKESVTEQADTDAPGYQCVWVDADEPPRYPLAPLIADSLQCLRTGLDQLAFELSSRGPANFTEKGEQACEFPIFGDVWKGKPERGRDLWKAQGIPKVEFAETGAQEVIEGKQPYHYGARFKTNPLWVVHELNRIEKHRMLHPVAMTLRDVRIPSPNRWSNVRSVASGTLFIGKRRIEGRTQIARFPLEPIDPSRVARVGIRPNNIGVVFADSVPLVGGKPVMDTLWRLYNHAVTEVVLPLRPFLE